MGGNLLLYNVSVFKNVHILYSWQGMYYCFHPAHEEIELLPK